MSCSACSSFRCRIMDSSEVSRKRHGPRLRSQSIRSAASCTHRVTRSPASEYRLRSARQLHAKRFGFQSSEQEAGASRITARPILCPCPMMACASRSVHAKSSYWCMVRNCAAFFNICPLKNPRHSFRHSLGEMFGLERCFMNSHSPWGTLRGGQSQCDEFIFTGAEAQRGGGLNGVDAVTGFHALEEMRLSGVVLGGVDEINAGLVNGYRVE